MAFAAAAAASSTTPPSLTRMGMGMGAGTSAEGVAATHEPEGGKGNQEKQKMDPVAAALRNASALLLTSIKAVTASVGPVVAGEKGARKVMW